MRSFHNRVALTFSVVSVATDGGVVGMVLLHHGSPLALFGGMLLLQHLEATLLAFRVVGDLSVELSTFIAHELVNEVIGRHSLGPGSG
jgi:hypothetical protein